MGNRTWEVRSVNVKGTRILIDRVITVDSDLEILENSEATLRIYQRQGEKVKYTDVIYKLGDLVTVLCDMDSAQFGIKPVYVTQIYKYKGCSIKRSK
jgi:hypothetical protein